jgi:hypothetical protein
MINLNLIVLCALVLFISLKCSHASGFSNYFNENNRFLVNNKIDHSANYSSKINRTQTPTVSWNRNNPGSVSSPGISLKSQHIEWTETTSQPRYSDLKVLFNHNAESSWLLFAQSFNSKANTWLNNALQVRDNKLEELKAFSALSDQEKAKIQNVFNFEEKNVKIFFLTKLYPFPLKNKYLFLKFERL